MVTYGSETGLVGLGVEDLATAIVAVRAHMVATMGLPARRIDGQSRPGQGVVGPAHAALGGCLTALLYRHFTLSSVSYLSRGARPNISASSANGLA